MNGDVARTFLVDGFVEGMWRVEDGRVEDGRVVLEPFAALSRSARTKLEDEARRDDWKRGRLIHLGRSSS